MLMRIPALSGVMRSSGAEYLGISHSGEIAIMKAGDWDESKHKRSENGQFGSGGSGKGKESAGAKHKRNQQARRVESAGQTALGGGKAIQSLLSGGSALDKIGWLNTSKKPEAAKEPEAKPEPKPAESKPKEPEKKPEAPAKVPAANIKSAKDVIRENLKSGKLKRETVIAAVRALQDQAKEAKAKGDYASSKDLNFQAATMAEAAEIKTHELFSPGKSPKRTVQAKPARQSVDERNDPKHDPFAGDPLHDPLPRGYKLRSDEETARYAREHSYKQPKPESDEDYKRRTGRDWSPNWD
jgi:hypothetical protein